MATFRAILIPLNTNHDYNTIIQIQPWKLGPRQIDPHIGIMVKIPKPIEIAYKHSKYL
jgi:hypothetical protein